MRILHDFFRRRALRDHSHRIFIAIWYRNEVNFNYIAFAAPSLILPRARACADSIAIPDSQQYSTLSNAIDIAAYVVNVYFTLPVYAADFYELKTRAPDLNASSATVFAQPPSFGHDLKAPSSGGDTSNIPCARLFDLGASSKASTTRGFVASHAPTATEWSLLARHVRPPAGGGGGGGGGDSHRASGNVHSSTHRTDADYCALYRARYLDPTSPVYVLHASAAADSNTTAAFRPSVYGRTTYRTSSLSSSHTSPRISSFKFAAADAAPAIEPARLEIENGLSEALAYFDVTPASLGPLNASLPLSVKLALFRGAEAFALEFPVRHFEVGAAARVCHDWRVRVRYVRMRDGVRYRAALETAHELRLSSSVFRLRAFAPSRLPPSVFACSVFRLPSSVFVFLFVFGWMGFLSGRRFPMCVVCVCDHACGDKEEKLVVCFQSARVKKFITYILFSCL